MRDGLTRSLWGAAEAFCSLILQHLTNQVSQSQDFMLSTACTRIAANIANRPERLKTASDAGNDEHPGSATRIVTPMRANPSLSDSGFSDPASNVSSCQVFAQLGQAAK